MDGLPDKAIAIIQPWAHLIVSGLKDIENRDWRTTYRGPVAIHASKRMPGDEFGDAMDTLEDATVPPLSYKEATTRGLQIMAVLQFGGIVGVADIIDCVEDSDSPWFFGRYGFVLANPRRIPFIPVKGALGFFSWRERVTA